VIIKWATFAGAILLPTMAPSAPAQVLNFTIDGSRSELQLSGAYRGETLIGQALGINTLTTSLTGTISGEWNASASTLSITGGTLSALPLGIQGSSSDYFFSTDSQTFGGQISSLTFSLSSVLENADPTFDVSNFTLEVSGGIFNYLIHGPTGGGTASVLPMTGSLSLQAGLGSYAEDGTEVTLSIPIQTVNSVTLTTQDNQTFPATLFFSGNIVATTPIPEPLSFGFLLPAAAILLRRRRP